MTSVHPGPHAPQSTPQKQKEADRAGSEPVPGVLGLLSASHDQKTFNQMIKRLLWTGGTPHPLQSVNIRLQHRRATFLDYNLRRSQIHPGDVDPGDLQRADRPEPCLLTLTLQTRNEAG